MIDYRAILLSIRSHLLTLSVCTTGVTSLSATATGFARSSGSFEDDGFVVGQEVTPTGFTVPANSEPTVITAIDALNLTCAGTTPEAEGVGRSLSVGLPSSRAWENTAFTPVHGVPYIVEQFVPGPMAKATLGAFGELEALPMYVPLIHVPSHNGSDAAFTYANALLTLFAPETALTIANATLRVRGDVAPYPGQLTPTAGGFAALSVTIPLRARAANSI